MIGIKLIRFIPSKIYILYDSNKAKTLKINEMINFLIEALECCIECYAKLKINRVIVPISLENLRDAAKLLPKAILLKYPVINVTRVNNTGLTEMELG